MCACVFLWVPAKAREGALFPVAGVTSCYGLTYIVLGIKRPFSALVTTAPHLSATAQGTHAHSHILFCFLCSGIINNAYFSSFSSQCRFLITSFMLTLLTRLCHYIMTTSKALVSSSFPYSLDTIYFM